MDLAQNVALEDVQYLAGHSNPQTTQPLRPTADFGIRERDQDGKRSRLELTRPSG